MIAYLYFGIGLFIIFVKCIAIVWCNSVGVYYNKDGIKAVFLAFIIDLLFWPADIVFLYNYIFKMNDEEKEEIYDGYLEYN